MATYVVIEFDDSEEAINFAHHINGNNLIRYLLTFEALTPRKAIHDFTIDAEFAIFLRSDGLDAS